MTSKTVEDLTDEELLIVFRGPDSPLDAYDLINMELALLYGPVDHSFPCLCIVTHEHCYGRRKLARTNEVWTKQLTPAGYAEDDLQVLKQKGPTGCRDWWCLQFWKEYTRRRNMHAAAPEVGAGQA